MILAHSIIETSTGNEVECPICIRKAIEKTTVCIVGYTEISTRNVVRIADKNEAAGAAVAGLCHTKAAWAGKVRHIDFSS